MNGGRFPRWAIGLTGTRYPAAVALHDLAGKAKSDLGVLRRGIAAARDAGLDRDRIAAIIASACPDLDREIAVLVAEPVARRGDAGWSHRAMRYDEVYANGSRPRIHKYAEICDAFKVRIDDRTIHADDALGTLAMIGAAAGFDYDTAATVAVATAIGPNGPERAPMTELRAGLAARMFERGWPA